MYAFKGIMEVHPGAINSIPSMSHLEIGKSMGIQTIPNGC